MPPDNLAYLLKYDTVYGKYSQQVDSDDNSLKIAGKEYKYFQEKDPESLPWKDLVDLTMTQVVDGDLIKIMSWYDNEWGYANQMVRQVLQQQSM